MKIGTCLLITSLALFLAVVLALMAALVGGYLSAWGYIAANVVWFGLLSFFAWIVNEAVTKAKDEDTSNVQDEE